MRRRYSLTYAETYRKSINEASLCLPGLNADFDGDILNIIGIVDKAIAYMFRKFDPIKRMIISRDNGLLNENFSIVKGQLIDLHVFCTIPGGENDRPQTYQYIDKEGKEHWLTKEEIAELEKAG